MMRKDSSAGKTPWLPWLNFPIFQCQLSSNRRQEVCYNPFLLPNLSEISQTDSNSTNSPDQNRNKLNSLPPPEMDINSLLIVAPPWPPAPGQVCRWGSARHQGTDTRSNINIPIQWLIAGSVPDNGSDTGVTNLRRLKEKRFPPSFRHSYSAFNWLSENECCTISCLLQETLFYILTAYSHVFGLQQLLLFW